MNDTPPDDKPFEVDEILGWTEFACWTVLALSPFLYWVNGPAVSHDQLVVRCGLVTIAVLGALGLRARKLLLVRRETKDE
jgi:hypothetical protein